MKLYLLMSTSLNLTLKIKKFTSTQKTPEFDRSIQENGILKPIICNRDFIILDGHRRWKRAKQFGLKQVPVQIRDFENEITAIIWLNRYRVKTPREIFNEARVLEEELAKEAKKRQLAQLKQFKNDKNRSVKFDTTGEQGKVRDQVAEKLGVSSGQLYKIKKFTKTRINIRTLLKKLIPENIPFIKPLRK